MASAFWGGFAGTVLGNRQERAKQELAAKLQADLEERRAQMQSMLRKEERQAEFDSTPIYSGFDPKSGAFEETMRSGATRSVPLSEAARNKLQAQEAQTIADAERKALYDQARMDKELSTAGANRSRANYYDARAKNVGVEKVSGPSEMKPSDLRGFEDMASRDAAEVQKVVVELAEVEEDSPTVKEFRRDLNAAIVEVSRIADPQERALKMAALRRMAIAGPVVTN